MSLSKALTAAAGNAAGDRLYVEDVFSTYLYTGNDSTQTITNGIDLDGEGGLVWTKARNPDPYNHMLVDTEQGLGYWLESNTTDAAGSFQHISVNSDGYNILGGYGGFNQNPSTYASWTFRKAEKFFDVVTWTGDGNSGRQISHNLGSAPAVIIIKSVSFANNWLYNHNFGASGYDLLYLDLTNSKSSQTYASGAIQAQPTDSSFTLKSSSSVNGSGNTYVAYLFASDAGGFGDDGSESIIKCGSYTFQYNQPNEIDVGFEPQFILYKTVGIAGSWTMLDTMRGWTVEGDNWLYANSSDAEGSNFDFMNPTATGFKVNDGAFGEDYIYIAIRRPMKTPESGTEVFATDTRGSTGDGKEPTYRSPFPVDMQFNRNRTYAGGDTQISARLTQASQMWTNLTLAESANAAMMFDYMNGVQTDTGTNTAQSAWMFKRATGFFDVVAWTGASGTLNAVTHGLGVKPELVILKYRTVNDGWYVYTSAAGYLSLEGNSGLIGSTDYMASTTDTSLNVSGLVSNPGNNPIAYLFATLAGVSKVGSYTGTGSNVDVDCGFSAGARFILIKRTDSTGDWYVWDSERGIVAGNDPYLLLNSTAAEVTSTDYIDPLASGFTVTSSAPAALNASGGSYIFMAIS